MDNKTLNKNLPLVSVVVVTYNSEKTVVETLESIKRQSYPNIELVVADDCSADNTCEIVKKWLLHNADFFSETSTVFSSINTGISANLNRGISKAQGEWIKTIAGDDLLVDNCIETFISFAKIHHNDSVFFSRVNTFSVLKGEKRIIEAKPSVDMQSYIDYFNNLNAREQFLEMLKNGVVLQSPSLFIKKCVFEQFRFPEEYKYMEDHPSWFRLTNMGVHLCMTPNISVYYRIGNSLSKRGKDSFYSRAHMLSQSLFFWNEKRSYYIQEGISGGYDWNKKLLLKYEMVEAFTQNKKNFKTKVIRYIIEFIVNKMAKYELPKL